MSLLFLAAFAFVDPPQEAEEPHAIKLFLDAYEERIEVYAQKVADLKQQKDEERNRKARRGLTIEIKTMEKMLHKLRTEPHVDFGPRHFGLPIKQGWQGIGPPQQFHVVEIVSPTEAVIEFRKRSSQRVPLTSRGLGAALPSQITSREVAYLKDWDTSLWSEGENARVAYHKHLAVVSGTQKHRGQEIPVIYFMKWADVDKWLAKRQSPQN